MLSRSSCRTKTHTHTFTCMYAHTLFQCYHVVSILVSPVCLKQSLSRGMSIPAAYSRARHQHTATHCNTLQHTATRYTILQHATNCKTVARVTASMC